MSTHEPAKDAEKTLAAVDESIQIALSAAGTATDAAQELQRLRLQVTTLIDGSKRSGMVLLKIDSPSQDIVVGVVLVTAVAIDAALRLGKRRTMALSLVIGLVLAALIIQTGRQ